jgi:hypothetical protein
MLVFELRIPYLFFLKFGFLTIKLFDENITLKNDTSKIFICFYSNYVDCLCKIDSYSINLTVACSPKCDTRGTKSCIKHECCSGGTNNAAHFHLKYTSVIYGSALEALCAVITNVQY